MLRCQDDSLYTGVTIDPWARFNAHARGKGAKYTKSHPPMRLVFMEPHENKGLALSREARIKQLSRAKKMQIVEFQWGELVK